MAHEQPKPDALTQAALSAQTPLEALPPKQNGRPPNLQNPPKPWSKKRERLRIEALVDSAEDGTYKDLDPGEWKDPKNEPTFDDNQKQADESEKRQREHEALFFPKPPKPASYASMARMSLANKKARFLQSYNSRGGNETFAMMESGFSRAQIKQMLEEDEEMMIAVAEIKIQIKDRAKYLLMQRIGLVKAPAVMAKVADNLLLQSAKALDKDLFGDEGAGTIKLILNIPRPERGSGSPGKLLGDGQANPSPQLPG